MTAEVDITVVTVTWNSQSVIRGFLESLPAAMGDVPWRLVLADNDSSDATLATARSVMPEARVVQVGYNSGYAGGINAAVEVAQRETHILVANPDIRLDAGAGQLLVEALREPGTGIVVPQLRNSAGELIFSIRRDATVRRVLGEAVLGGDRAGRWIALGETATRAESYARAADVDWASGAVMAISRECAELVGTWDESMWLYSEETDYCLRAREAGFRVRYVPEARAVHFGGDSGGNPLLWTALTVNRIRLFERRHSRLHSVGFRCAVTLNEALRALVGRPTNKAALWALIHSRHLAPPRPPLVSCTRSAGDRSASDSTPSAAVAPPRQTKPLP